MTCVADAPDSRMWMQSADASFLMLILESSKVFWKSCGVTSRVAKRAPFSPVAVLSRLCLAIS